MTRESIFTCSFTGPRGRRVSHVRAWDEGEATRLFEEELRDDEVREPGRIEVVSARGHRRVEARFDPSVAAH